MGFDTSKTSCQSRIRIDWAGVRGMLSSLPVRNVHTERGYRSYFGNVDVRGNNPGSISLEANARYSARIKHRAIRYYLLTDLVGSGKIKLHRVPSASQLAYVLTKCLSNARCTHLVTLIANLSNQSIPWYGKKGRTHRRLTLYLDSTFEADRDRRLNSTTEGATNKNKQPYTEGGFVCSK